MSLELMIALILVMPIIILCGVFVWYLNIGGIYATVKDKRKNRQVVVESKNPETVQP